jgi:hypothetical protein
LTLYCQTLDRLPRAHMARLGSGSKVTHFIEQDAKTGAEVERYRYAWKDFAVDLFVTRRPEIKPHLEEFITYAARIVRAGGRALDPAFVRRVRATRLMVGYVAGPDYEEAGRFRRFEDLILTLAQTTQSLLFWEGRVYDEAMQLLIG